MQEIAVIEMMEALNRLSAMNLPIPENKGSYEGAKLLVEGRQRKMI